MHSSASLDSTTPPLSDLPAENLRRLSERQRQCLRLIFDRKTSKEIASALGLSVGTVNTYISEAITTLGARNRRHAAELLHDFESKPTHPDKVQLHIIGVSEPPSSADSPVDSSSQYRRLLPVRQPGASGNDLSIFIRLFWPLAIAILCAIAFGMLAVGIRIVSDVLRAVLR
ncbi:DNA-binding CsgD family transcriptional regulator [Sphingomonas endophytica]|uniref:DNA-binding CsgD family transcriptional regulator n=1 Tax=Sphingomonas endophytica TaxID=869719 RepID=A0ABR6N8K3_9SPHN|nr:helix-turn-helix transcriptional regulator [Sphingomonas endophytica]MBB5727123.1 DNA-binding CsgD family transcriptional regulator [Sphingomonas endophytica]